MKVVVLIDKYPCHTFCQDAIRVFEQREEEGTLCFGVHEWTMEDVEAARRSHPGKLIAYQSELMYCDSDPFRNDNYALRLQQFDEVWDYSEHNIPWLKAHGVGNVRLVPIEPSPILRDAPRPKDINILHVGVLSTHRCQVLNALQHEGFRVYDVLQQYGHSVTDDPMRELYRRSRVVLGIHTFTHTAIQECFRYQYPLSNNIAVVAEKSLTNPLQLSEYANLRELTAALGPLVPRQKMSETELLEGHFFPMVESYLHEGNCDCILNKDNLTIVGLARQMANDAAVIMQMRKRGIRTSETQHQSIVLFNDMMRLLVRLETRGAFPSKRLRKVLTSQLHQVYRHIDRKTVRTMLASTGGILWPNLRSDLQTRGWNTLKLSLTLLTVLHLDRKFVHVIKIEDRPLAKKCVILI